MLGEDVAFNDGVVPVEAEQLGYREFLSMQDLLMVRENLRQQRENYSGEELLRATRNYFRNDAYVDLERGDLT